MNKGDVVLDLIAALSLFFSAVAAWLAKRNNRELKPKKSSTTRIKRASGDGTILVNGISVKDLAVNVLDEVNRVHRRLDKIGVPQLEREDDETPTEVTHGDA